jgi:hypothetical protein
MNQLSRHWSTLHPSAYRQDGQLMHWVAASLRPHGALRYQCPVTGSLVLVTDEATLSALKPPRARLRCPNCGDMHLLLIGEAGAQL